MLILRSIKRLVAMKPPFISKPEIESPTTRTAGGLDFAAIGGKRQGREVPQSLKQRGGTVDSYNLARSNRFGKPNHRNGGSPANYRVRSGSRFAYNKFNFDLNQIILSTTFV
jgi:hypothetical protein